MSSEHFIESVPGVFYSSEPVVTAGADTIAFLKAAARASLTRRARLCAHPSPAHDQHDMLIVSHRDTYVAPHRHHAKSETMLVIEGEAMAVLFGESGDAEQAVRMMPFGGTGRFFYRMPAGRFHGLMIRSEFLVFTESTKGPFLAEASEHAPWAPAPNDAEGGRQFYGKIDALIAAGQLPLQS